MWWCFNINESIKIEIAIRAVGSGNYGDVYSPRRRMICNLGGSRERARCGVFVASLRRFFVLIYFLSTFNYLYLFVIIYYYYLLFLYSLYWFTIPSQALKRNGSIYM